MCAVRDSIRQKSFLNYIFSPRTYWYWGTLILTILTAIVVLFFPPENSAPIAFTRYILGAAFVLWFPGYTFAKAFLPWRKLSSLERITLSLTLSLAIVAIEGLALNYTVQGVEIVSVTMTLMISTLAFATVAIIKEYKFSEKEQ